MNLHWSYRYRGAFTADTPLLLTLALLLVLPLLQSVTGFTSVCSRRVGDILLLVGSGISFVVSLSLLKVGRTKPVILNTKIFLTSEAF